MSIATRFQIKLTQAEEFFTTKTRTTAWTQEQLPRSGSFSGNHLPNSPETPPRATRLDVLIPAYLRARHSSVHVEMTLLDRLVYDDGRSAWERDNEVTILVGASSQAPAWEFGVGSSSFPSRDAATVWMQEVEQRRKLPRASPSGFPIWRLGTRAIFCSLSLRALRVFVVKSLNIN
jgi:hypothetical protein